MKTADQVFCSELDGRGIQYTVSAEGYYEIQAADQTVLVSLENIRRDYDRNGDAGAIARFVDTIQSQFFTETPSWDDVQAYVRYSLEPADMETGSDDVVLTAVNDELNQVFVYVSADGTRITWIIESMLEDWNVSREQVIEQAEKNMAGIISETRFEVEDIAGHKLGMLSTEETPFKASLILSPAFRHLVSPTLGWPVYVVVPCRDFAYVIRHDDSDFLGRLGQVVLKEYSSSGYPITKDVLEVSDSGVASIATFAEPG